jgi:hypothetical protein
MWHIFFENIENKRNYWHYLFRSIFTPITLHTSINSQLWCLYCARPQAQYCTVQCTPAYTICKVHKGRLCTEPIFADLLRRPGIDFQPGGPVRHPYFSYRPVRLHRLAKSIPRNRFLGSINIYKYGLCSTVRTLDSEWQYDAVYINEDIPTRKQGFQLSF